MINYDLVKQASPIIYNNLMKEWYRQNEHVELIASENFVSPAVMQAMGSVFNNKYAEGYPGKRYYGGCEFVDEVETYTINRLCQLFGADHANVQPHSGANANLAVFSAFLEPGDKVLGMKLDEGGHLTHGSPVNFSGKTYDFTAYGLDPETERIDYEDVRQKALESKPKMIIAGYSAYPRDIDFKKFREIADEVGAILLVDMAHFAGLAAVGLLNNPVEYADICTTTTHKTLRGPRGGAILCKAEHAKKIDSAVFPGLQGGPLEHIIAAKGVCFDEASRPEFLDYQKQVLANMKAMASVLKEGGLKLVTDGTDNHLILVDVRPFDLKGNEAEKMLEDVFITTNKNTVPRDPETAFVTSGLRIGSPAMTTRGFKEEEFEQVAKWILEALKQDRSSVKIKQDVIDLTSKFPLYR